MTRYATARLWRALRRSAPLAGVVLLSVVTTLRTQRLLTPPAATAQSIQTPEVRANAFVLVGSDGTVIGRLGAGSAGDGVLTLSDSSGQLHMAVSGAGDLLAYGTGGTALVQIYADPKTNDSGLLVRDVNGRLRVIAAQSLDSAAVRVQDLDGNPRVGIGTLADASGGSTEDYGLRVRDSDGAVVTTVP
ncbi:MAG TPA: hypothetical protein VK821_16905 [Dehalococcoidia bacterium]|nr:hypothetical protein [Dehalococcoidia bacterium]